MRPLFTVQCTLQGLGAEKLLNTLKKQEILLSFVDRMPDRSLVLQCARGQYGRIQELAQEKGFTLSPARPVGLYRFLMLFFHRRGLILGLVLCLGWMIYAMGYIWQIKIENAGAYEGEVRFFLQEKGIQPGLRRGDVNLSLLREELEWRLPKVKWVRAEYAGVSLKIVLEEGTPPPDIQSHKGSGDVVAGEDGLLIRLTCSAGTPVAKAGDFVKKGQVLIRGEERGRDDERIAVQAGGEAIARIWVSAQARVSLYEMLSLPTGRLAERRLIVTPFFSLALGETPDFLTWDLERQDRQIGGIWLPVLVRREQYGEVSLEKMDRDLEAVRQEAGKAALQMLHQALYHENIVDKWLEFRMIEGDTIAATATAEIYRNIAVRQIN